MKKIINYKKYDTDTAKLVEDYWNGDTGFYEVHEMLYQKKTGEFFLHGEGGALTEYAVSCGNNQRTGSSRIVPLSKQEAKEWVMEHMDGDAYEDLFGEVAE